MEGAAAALGLEAEATAQRARDLGGVRAKDQRQRGSLATPVPIEELAVMLELDRCLVLH